MTRSRALAGLAVLVLAAPLLPWLALRSTSSEAWTGLLLLLLGAVMLGRFGTAPAPAASTALVGVGAFVVVGGAAFDVRLLQAMGLATLIVGAWPLLRGRGAPSLPALILLLLGLPLTGDIDVVGFPLRRLSAELAALALPVLGVPVAFTETVLVTENGLADVEAPCAGLSTLRLLVATVAVMAAARRSRIVPLGLAVAAAVIVAVLGNASRVAILSWLVLGAERPDLAALLHVPLGVCAFLAAAAAAVPLLGPAVVSLPGAAPVAPAARDRLVVVTLVGAAVLSTGLRLQRPERSAPVTAGVVAGDIPLGDAEVTLYRRHALAAGKRRLMDAEGVEVGEALFVVTRGLRAIHAPERCLASSGHGIVDVDVVMRRALPVKRLVLDGGDAIGLSFLRSPQHHGTGLGDVVMARFAGDAGPWVFVSAVVRRDALLAPGAEDALVADLIRDADALFSAPSSGAPP